MTAFMDNCFRTKPLEVIEAEERKEDLPRELGLWDLIMIGVGGTIGSGVFALSGSIIQYVAGPGAFLSWIIAGLSCILSGFAYMEMSSIVPSSGSTYAYAYHVLGELPAVIGAWLLTLEYGLSGAGVARSWAGKVQSWAEEGGGSFPWLNEEHYNLVGAAIMAVSVLILLMGIRFGKVFINTVSAMKCSVVIFIIIAGFSYMAPSNLRPFVPAKVPANETAETEAQFGTQGILLGAAQAFFGYVGFDEVCCLAAEAKNPRKIMPRAVVGTIVGTMLLSSFASLALSAMIPYDIDTGDNDLSFSIAFQYVDAHWASTVVHIGEIVTMPVVVLVSFLAQPRLMYAMSVDGLLPRIFGHVDRNGNLFWCTLISGAVFTLIAFTVPFDYLWNMVSFGILLSFIMTNAAMVIARTRAQSTITYKLTGANVLMSAISMFLFQKGYLMNGNTGCLIASVIILAIVVVLSIMHYMQCPHSSATAGSYRAPFVPFLPFLSITINWFLISQLAWLDIGLGFCWIGLAILSYFLYGFWYSAGKQDWFMTLNEDHMISGLHEEMKKSHWPGRQNLIATP
jgi:APA family basic amino acid/polyamine antiporter